MTFLLNSSMRFSVVSIQLISLASRECEEFKSHPSKDFYVSIQLISLASRESR